MDSGSFNSEGSPNIMEQMADKQPAPSLHRLEKKEWTGSSNNKRSWRKLKLNGPIIVSVVIWLIKRTLLRSSTAVLYSACKHSRFTTSCSTTNSQKTD